MSPAKTARLFVAVPPGEAVRAEIAATVERLRQVLASAGVRASFPGPENLHLTLRFLGDQPAALIEPIGQALQAVAATDRPEIAFGGLGAFPDEKKPRVLWLGVAEGAESLKSLAEQVDRCLEPLGIELDDRPFRPHLTLARPKGIPRLPRDVLDTVCPYSELRLWVSEIVLFRSDLDSSGPRHVPLTRVPLGAG